MSTPLLVVGLDGATLDLVEPWARDGRLPTLAGLMARGAWGRLRSTVPAATFPAWTTLVTGVNPGRHGVLDFTERVPGTHRVRFVNGSHRRSRALWERLGARGRRVAVLTVPATYPPEPVNGLMVSGFDTPLTTAIDASFVWPRTFYRDIRRLVGRLPFADFQELDPGPGWHERALESLLDGVERRARVAAHVLEQERWDLVMVVFGESDTVAHHFWRFHDAASPRYAPSPHGEAIVRVYEALDRAVGRLLAAAPPETAVAIVSDHGVGGAGDRVVHVNRQLAACGLFEFRPQRSGWDRALRTTGLRVVPARFHGALLRRGVAAAGRLEGRHRFGGIEWSRTVAYSEELDYHPSVWLNLRGREPEGIVEPAEYEAVRARVARALTAWRDEAGAPVLARVWRREEIYHGPFVVQAPDLLLEFAHVGGYTPSCLRSDGPGASLRQLRPEEHTGGKGIGMNGTHRRDGLLLLAGRGVGRVGRLPAADIADVLPTLLVLGAVPVPDGLDGKPLTTALAASVVIDREPDPLPSRTGVPHELGPGATRELAQRLVALGYLDEPEP